MAAAEGGDPLPGCQLADAADKPQTQGASLGAAAVRHRLNGALCHRQQIEPALIEDLSPLGQLQRVGAAQEEGAAQLRLQQLHLLADRRLGHVQLLGSPVDAALLHHCDKVLDLLQVHFNHLYKIHITLIVI